MGQHGPRMRLITVAEHVKQSRLLLFVHAAAHDEALRAISQAAADCGVAARSRCAAATFWL